MPVGIYSVINTSLATKDQNILYIPKLSSQKARQVIVMRCRFAWLCMYTCISADCTMQFYACACISTTLAQYNPMLVSVHHACTTTAQSSGQNVQRYTTAWPVWPVSNGRTQHKHFKSLLCSLRIAYDFSDPLKINLNVCRVCCPLNDQIDSGVV